ncbi:iron ABC transporter permease [Paenibacillus athensensis]|uniref:Iron ABC transporter permease n=1 Tax=Paenibacillus athensensis TaxID=1967502 RepID=A0A4Y8Q3Y9_9BACL|nr:iron ABC transporter permease [Paenibacillus athensensis]MCD1258401.1 iron ABC transporter permease [Paenibacillus athensensis]
MNKRYWTWRLGRFSFLLERRAMRVVVWLVALVAVVFLVSAGTGSTLIAPWNVIKALFGQGSKGDHLVLYSFRLPRLVIGLLVGSSLAVSGAILQGMIRNPLASPDMLGVTGGATAAAVGFLAFFTREDLSYSLSVSIAWLPPAAFCGALLVGLAVYALAWKRGITPLRLVLIGIGVAAGMSSLTTMLLVKSPSVYAANEAYIWMTGSIYSSTWTKVRLLLPWTAVLLPAAFLLARRLNVHRLGDDTAVSVGGALERERLWMLLVSIGLAGSAVAFAGGIGFVGLMAPHIARRLVGGAHGGLLPASACIGAVLVMLADLLGRTAFPPFDVPCGVFIATVGAPYFIYLLYRNRHQ